ncbi:MAG: metalloregulator ArsR/SmtB family transcription factor [Phycisphaerae bacterium]|nr:metalloregulator ArsR/SmtB family transcription factor [Phycisphaerae bacterium]
MSSDHVFKAMADRTRRALLQVLLQNELSVSELVEVLGQPQSTISRHLRVLREAELVSERRDGTTVLSSAIVPGANGETSGLHARIVEWAGQQPVAKAVARRLDSVLRRRSARAIGFFEDVGQRWDQMRIECFGDRFHLEALLSLLPPDWVVADIGTGTGYLLPVLAGCFRRVIAIDPVETMLGVARGRPELAKAANVEFRQGDLSRLPLDDEAVDLAIAVLVLHHVPSPGEAVREIARVVRPGGRVLVVEYQAHELREFHERMQDRWWGFAPDELAGRLEAAGLRDVRRRTLTTAEPLGKAAVEAPDLYVMTATRPREK